MGSVAASLSPFLPSFLPPAPETDASNNPFVQRRRRPRRGRWTRRRTRLRSPTVRPSPPPFTSGTVNSRVVRRLVFDQCCFGRLGIHLLQQSCSAICVFYELLPWSGLDVWCMISAYGLCFGAQVVAFGKGRYGSVQHYIRSLVVFLHLPPSKVDVGLSEIPFFLLRRWAPSVQSKSKEFSLGRAEIRSTVGR